MKPLEINMLLPIDVDGVIVVPANIFSWIKRVRRIREVIDLGDSIVIEQWDDAIYFQTISIHGGPREFLRYDVITKTFQYWNNGAPIVFKTLEDLERYYNKHFKECNLKPGFKIEKL